MRYRRTDTQYQAVGNKVKWWQRCVPRICFTLYFVCVSFRVSKRLRYVDSLLVTTNRLVFIYFNIRRFAWFVFGFVFSSNLFCFKVCPYWWNKDFVKCSLPPLWPRCSPGLRCLQTQRIIGRYTPRSLADRPSKYFNSKRCLPTHIPFHFAPKPYYVVSNRIR